jgi:hypothetical protein
MKNPHTIGLADWYIYEHTDGRRTALRQTVTQLILAVDRPGAPVWWRVYGDVHGMRCIGSGETKTLEDVLSLFPQ